MRSNDPNVFPCLEGGVHRWKAVIRSPPLAGRGVLGWPVLARFTATTPRGISPWATPKLFKWEIVHTARQSGIFLNKTKGQQSSPVGRAGRKARRLIAAPPRGLS